MRKTKIICTLGPASDSPEMIRQLMLSGMNGARFNFSHATHEYAKEKLAVVKQLRQELKLPVATILDTKGPEIRIGTFKNHKVELKEGQLFTLTTEEVEGTENQVSITYKDLPKDIEEGRTVLLDDGLIEMKVMTKTETTIVCRVENGGMISDRKGINVPGTKLSMPFISERDRSDIIFGIEEGFDCIAASFTRNAEDILAVRKILDEHDCHSINIIAKIENAEGVENIDQILRVVDGIMVARGDMGVEIPLEDVPILQKKLIKKAYLAGKQVITATQMLDSMIKNPRPTRAESTDVANAIYDGTSAIMLSGETAAGSYPVEALKTMVRIAERTEEAIDYIHRFQSRETIANFDVTNAISHATCTTAHDLGASAIITVTMSGVTARQLSKFRPASPIVACTNRETVYHQLSLSWGVIPMQIETETDSESLFEHAVEAAQRAGLVHSGDLVVITAGVPLGVSGTTNMMKVDVVGHVLVTGEGVTEKQVTARVCVAETVEDMEERFQEGDIIVTHNTSNDWIEYLHTAGGVITEQPGINSHAAIVGLAMNKPVIVGAQNATKILKTGSVVLLDAEKGLVSRS
ncbi:MAG TPA: pyruvate kinase [Candidatus Egerieicola faecale]|uniref:Pyruvate kinase n=1 Tax=Candidatus Egerieicola faecale TaxID=2840774 RepID=A0A9D1IPD6_9FIRM|nr:pyruvate kinase [Candidatus Egerieicola faecale]